MKIDPKHVSGTAQETLPVIPGCRGKDTSTAGSRTDDLVLSVRAEEFRRVRPQLDGVPESREERIALIRTRVRSTYRVLGEHIAEAMLRDKATMGLLGLRPEK